MTDVELEVAESFERVFPVPTVVADWDDVLDRAGARSGTPTRPPSRWRLVAIAVAIVAVAALLATPALGIGDRLLSLIQGKQSPLDVQAPAWSRDGRTIVFVSWRDGNGEVYAMDADGSGPRNLTQNPAKDVRPAWSPDGRRIAFVSRRDGNSEVYVMNADGSGKRNLTRDRAQRRLSNLVTRRAEDRVPARPALQQQPGRPRRAPLLRLPPLCRERRRQRAAQADAQPDGDQYQLVWSPDGRTIYFGRYLVSTDGSGARRLPYIPLTAVWSPDGRRIAFVNDTRDRTRSLVCAAESLRRRYLRHERRRERNPQADAQRTL